MKFVNLRVVFVGGTLLTTSNGVSGTRGSKFAIPGDATHEEDLPRRLLRGHAAILGNEEERVVDFTMMGNTLGTVLGLLDEFLAALVTRNHALRPSVMEVPQDSGVLRGYHGVSNRRPSPLDDNVVLPSTGQMMDEHYIAFKNEYDTYKSKNPSATIDEQVKHLLGKVFQRPGTINSAILLQLAREKEGVDTAVLDAIEKVQFERLKDFHLDELRVGWTSPFVIPSDDSRVLNFINAFLGDLEKHRLKEKVKSLS
uniref:RxLR effector candidate protein n=1 Tax=Peronospora matthiolae TaxID=2874970 RepID=A0AAV1VBK6_9STRA